MHVLRFHECGPAAEVLRLEDLKLPDLEKGEVRLRVLASPINPADLNFIEGTYGVKPELPSTPGIEGCAEVVESRAEGFAPGERCIFVRRAGLWASHVQVPASYLLKLPEGVDPQQAAMLKVNPATAWHLLKTLGDLPRGSWVVQNAANSAVGQAVIQLAATMGIHTLNLVRRAELIPQLVMLGADQVLLDDGDVAESAKAICGSLPPMLAFNAVGGDSALRLMNCLAEGGTHVTYGAMARRPLKVPNGMLIFKDLNLKGLWVTRWIEGAAREEIEKVYGVLAGEMLAGNLHLQVDSSFSLPEVCGAIERLSDPERSGKVLLEPV